MFEASEKYRKYVVKLILTDSVGYAIWGTDLSTEDEEDCFLVTNGKVVVFTDQKQLLKKSNDFENVFFDSVNFKRWLQDEDLSSNYSSFDIKQLRDLNVSQLLNKKNALELLDSINIIEDFFIQVNSQTLNLFGLKKVRLFKDFLYNKYFWKGGEDERLSIELNDLKAIFNKIYDAFIEKLYWVK